MSISIQESVSAASASESVLCEEIPFQVVSHAASTLRHVPMTNGFCVPKGALKTADHWHVEGLGETCTDVQTEVLNRWSDGSVRWLLAHFVADRLPVGKTKCALARIDNNCAKTSSGRAAVCREERGVTLQLRLSSDGVGQSTDIAITPRLTSNSGQDLPLCITAVEEAVGRVRSVFRIDAHVAESKSVELQIRLEVWPAAGLVKAETRIRNSRRAAHKGGLWDLGDSGSYEFGGLHLDLSSVFGPGAEIQWKAESQGEVQNCRIKDGFQIVQYGSGSEQWNSSNHMDYRGESSVTQQGYVLNSAHNTQQGSRSEPTVAIVVSDWHTSSESVRHPVNREKQLSVAVPEFWQQFPGSIGVEHNGISIGLFPTAVAAGYELQGGEQKTLSTWMSTQGVGPKHDHLDWVYNPPQVLPSAEWVRQCRVFPWLPEAPKSFSGCAAGRLTDYLAEATSNDFSFTARRDRIDEYGWRNFGDVPADHEQTHFKGDETIVSHYNNQFDLIFGGIQNLMTSEDERWFDLFEPLARHVMDIDIYHTAEDRACFNGGLFWHTDHYVDAHTATHRTYSKHNAAGKESYGGGPSNEHNYTTGLMYYHFLTGSQEARETVISLANWVINMDDGTRTIWGLFDSGDTGLATQTVFEDFHGPGRGAGNSINALLDGWILTGDDEYMVKAEQLIRRVVHPNQDCEELQLADAEGHWSYTVCLTALGRYLNVKAEAGQLDETYAYVRETLAHYGRWMAANEKPSLSEPDKLEYPTEAWAAQDFRKANVLRIAASCTDAAKDELAMTEKANEINNAAWKDLYAFGRQHLTARCLSILMTEGLRDVFHRTCRPEYLPPTSKKKHTWNEWTMFVPQKQRIKQLRKTPFRAVQAMVGCLNPRRILQTIDAIRRQM